MYNKLSVVIQWINIDYVSVACSVLKYTHCKLAVTEGKYSIVGQSQEDFRNTCGMNIS